MLEFVALLRRPPLRDAWTKEVRYLPSSFEIEAIVPRDCWQCPATIVSLREWSEVVGLSRPLLHEHGYELIRAGWIRPLSQSTDRPLHVDTVAFFFVLRYTTDKIERNKLIDSVKAAGNLR